MTFLEMKPIIIKKLFIIITIGRHPIWQKMNTSEDLMAFEFKIIQIPLIRYKFIRIINYHFQIKTRSFLKAAIICCAF